MSEILTASELRRLLSDPQAAESCSVASAGSRSCLVVDLREIAATDFTGLFQPVCTVIGIGQVDGAPIPSVVDVLAGSDLELEALTRAVHANPIASCVLTQVLRHNAAATVQDGLLVESLAYSALQHGTEFERWLARRPPTQSQTGSAEPALLERTGDCLRITLNRPDKRNAFSAAMRDALCAALEVALLDEGVRGVNLAGAGAAFCAGGDLDEFGSARDAAMAHATRVTRSAGALLHQLRDRVTCHVHGACIGAGIELPAFTGKIHARSDAYFQLPEVAMGLIPGAGGTVSIPQRIGRLRAAELALSGKRIDAGTALEWGLVDAIVDGFD